MAEVIDRDLGWKDFVENVRTMGKGDAHARVGLFAGDENARVAPGIANGDFFSQALEEGAGAKAPPTNVDIGVWMEFGVPSVGIPERSWLRSAFDTNVKRWAKFAEKLTLEILDGHITTETALGQLGAKASADVKKGITRGEGIPPPNAPSTIARKGSSRPLVDTGQFVGAITWDVEGGESEGE